MTRSNFTAVAEFTFEGFSIFGWQHRLILFVVFLALYLLTLASNVIILTVIHLNRQLHTPMYFFLSVLSISETCYTVAIIPRMLASLLSPQQAISAPECATQLFFYLTFGVNNCFLLTAMGYDRYVAICNPLRYPIIMNRVLYVHMAAWSWIIGCLNSLVQTVLTMVLPFCGNNIIDHLTCELLALLKLTCSDITINVFIVTIASIIFLVIPLLLIFISYVFIFHTVLRLNSTEGRKKAFSTCSDHLAVVI